MSGADSSTDGSILNQCLTFLRELTQNGEKLTELSETDRVELMRLTGQVSRPSKVEIKQRNKALNRTLRKKIREHDRSARAVTGIRKAREVAVFVAPDRVLPPAHSEVSTVQPELQS